MAERVDVVVIGGGQAGLSTSHELTRAGVEHVVLERDRIGTMWRGRWDSFCLVTPNWTVMLPWLPYDGDDPHGFMPRDEIVAYLERYAAAVGAPVREGVAVDSLEPLPGGGFHLSTTNGDVRAGSVVVATGGYQRPFRPPGAEMLPTGLFQIDIDDYRNPGSLPDGPVLVVGSGQSGCQVTEELHDAGRAVFLSCGKAPWVPRRLGGRDIVWWGVETGFVDQPVEALPFPAARLAANLLTSGSKGGHDLHYRTLRAAGVTLLGHFLGAEGRRARFAPDLGESVAWGDERFAQLADLIRKTVAERGMPMPEIPEPDPFDGDAPEEVDLTGFGAVVFAGGFRPDYGSLIPVPGAFDEMGFPIQVDGASTGVPGLYFMGVHFQRKRKSATFIGVGEDAGIVARRIAGGSRDG